MVWGNSLRFSHHSNNNLIKCFNSPIVIGRDSMNLQLNKSNIDNENMLPMVWGSSLRFSHPCKNNSIKCFKSLIVATNPCVNILFGFNILKKGKF